MKLNEIKEIGFYVRPDDKDRHIIYEINKNTDEKWLKETPEQKFLIDTWTLDRTDNDDRKVYEIYAGNLVATNNADPIDVIKIKDTKYKMVDKQHGFVMREDKPSYKEQVELLEKTISSLERKLNKYKKATHKYKQELENEVKRGEKTRKMFFDLVRASRPEKPEKELKDLLERHNFLVKRVNKESN